MKEKLAILKKKILVNSRIRNRKKMPVLFFFTDRKRIKDFAEVIDNLPANSAIVIREYDLSYSSRLGFAYYIKSLVRGKNIKLIAGKSYRLAVEAKLDGVHYSDADLLIKPDFCHQRHFIFTCACHNQRSLYKVQKLGFDLAFFSPIFATKTHPEKIAIGTRRLAKIIDSYHIAIAALGGVNDGNIRMLLLCKVSAVAGISYFNR